MAKVLDSKSLSTFFEGVSMMLSAGIQTDEAVLLLEEGMQEGAFQDVCKQVSNQLVEGKSMAEAMESSGAFPTYALDMVRAGDAAGRLEPVLASLAQYYAEEERLFAKMRSAVVYPAALLGIMTVILLFTVAVILPVFMNVYESMAGNLASSSYGYVNAAMTIGWVAFVVLAICTLVALSALAMSRGRGRERLMRILQKLPSTHDAMYRLGLSRFTSALATFTSTGMDSDIAMERACEMIDHEELLAKCRAALNDMTDPTRARSLTQAIYENDVFDPIHARMMVAGNRSGMVEEVMRTLSGSFFDDAVIRLDGIIESIEPALAAFLTVSVGATLIAVMLPLIGIMSSIG